MTVLESSTPDLRKDTVVEVSDQACHLRAAGTSVVLDLRGSDLPRLVYWGEDLGEMADPALMRLIDAQQPQPPSASPDSPPVLALLPEARSGWFGTPGLAGSRDGAAFSTWFRVRAARLIRDEAGGQRIVVSASDPDAQLSLELELELTAHGLLRSRARVTNEGTTTFQVDGLTLAFPVPEAATDLLDLAGRHTAERHPQRSPFAVGTHLRESRRGRPGHDATLLLVAGEAGFNSREGHVWGVHLGWSGNHRLAAERLSEGWRVLSGGELLLPGEVRLAPSASYESPWLYGSQGVGLDGMADRFHAWLRTRSRHPRTRRPVTLNTWEAVYFQQDPAQLCALADLAAGVGVERFVLDDGWFGSRRNDSAGLGDWYVAKDVWPEGLRPLADRVHERGMEFGLWVEPEMVNLDSDLARDHPDWLLKVPGRTPLSSRRQHALDLSLPAVRAYLLGRLDALISEYDIDYLKWDHNRDLVDPGHGPAGTPSVRNQVLALYSLLAELRQRHPGLEIEDCASGGGRVDLGILQYTDRVWTSDCIDPLERVDIQRWTELLLPPELLGAHIGAACAHTTGRTHTLGFRAGVAMPFHLGIEWDLGAATAEELAELGAWVRVHREWRDLLHRGRRVHVDHPDPAVRLHGTVAQDGSCALFVLVTVASSWAGPPRSLRLPGLDPDVIYEVRPLAPGDRVEGSGADAPSWWWSGARMSGRAWELIGVAAPVLFPERSVLFEVRQVG